jgi:hypothetical protein
LCTIAHNRQQAQEYGLNCLHRVTPSMLKTF